MVRLLLTCILLLLAVSMQPSWADPSAHRKPQLATGAAFDPEGHLWLVGIEHGKLFIRKQMRDGRWHQPHLIDNNAEVVSTHGDNWPKIAFGPNRSVVITYTRPLAKPYTGEIRMLRSQDGGISFSAPFTVHQDRQMITHRFESIMFDARGDLYVVWIDKRDAERVRAAAYDDPDAYAGAAIYYAISQDQGKTFGPDTKLADYSCECCRIAIVAEPRHGVALMWRHIFADSVRDHAFARIDTAGSSPLQRASFDQWVLKACPHHGPGLAPAVSGGYHAVWFGDRAEQLRVRYGRLNQIGQPSIEAIELPDHLADHADVASVGHRVAIVWRVFDGEVTYLRAWLSENNGESFQLRTLRSTPLENDYPRLAVKHDRIVVVWRTANEIYVDDLL